MPDGHSSQSLPIWVIIIGIITALLLTAGAIIALVRPAMLAPSGQAINGAVQVYAGYLVSRNLAIAAMLLGAIILRARGALSVLMVLAALVQLFDAGMNWLEGRWVLIPGVLVLGALLFAGAKRLGFRRESST